MAAAGGAGPEHALPSVRGPRPPQACTDKTRVVSRRRTLLPEGRAMLEDGADGAQRRSTARNTECCAFAQPKASQTKTLTATANACGAAERCTTYAPSTSATKAQPSRCALLCAAGTNHSCSGSGQRPARLGC